MHEPLLLETTRTRVQSVLAKVLPAANQEPITLHEAMHYAVLNNAKRLRPALIYAVGELAEINDTILDMLAVMVELIHSYSLVHDDLPALDNDDLRRGRPTCHKVFGEATAILVGDALQNLAFEVLASFQHPLLTPQQQINLFAILTKACNSSGMVGGQAIDIAVAGQKISLTKLEDMHRRKTGALLLACVMLPTSISHLSLEQQILLRQFGEELGLAFQIRDDIIDIESSTAVLGKQQGSDLQHEKPTYPSVLGMVEAKQKLMSTYENAQKCLNPFGDAAEPLRTLLEYIVKREH